LKSSDRLPISTKENESDNIRKKSIYGLAIASFAIAIWSVSLIGFFYLDLTKISWWSIPIAIAWQMFLYTGLFITAHDAMHGSIFPQNSKINHQIGAIALGLYGFFSYQELLKKHWLHHRYPASDLDPDFHDGVLKNGVSWYFSFIKRYWGWRQIIGQTIAVLLLIYCLHVSLKNFVLFWMIPPLLSSIQLFFFGTFLPHREPKTGYVRPHCAKTTALPRFWSFVSCYHFGYHQEHHQYPDVPWWQLPAVYQQCRSAKRLTSPQAQDFAS
jgi:beta-carotene/zeaxanthin 4-ketolase